MDLSGDDDLRHLSEVQILQRVQKMVEAGRMTEDDAARLRAAADAGRIDEAVDEIRRKHMRARVAAAVEGGRISEQEAAVLVERLEDGEDPRHLARGLRTRPVTPRRTETGSSPDTVG